MSSHVLRRYFWIFCAAFTFITGSVCAANEYDEEAPDKNYVWMDSYELDDGQVVEGFYRERNRAGYTWVDGQYTNVGTWIEPHWQPVAARPGYLWVSGHVGPDGFWVPGHWRHKSRVDFVWVAPAVVNGVWMHGYWRPRLVRAGFIWLPGHPDVNGVWITGHWRPIARAGFRWTAGRWRYGVWVPGFWNPITVKADHVWVGGYWGAHGWVAGSWRPKLRLGFYWSPAHWGPRGWVVGRWLRGTRPSVVRRFPRVVRVAHMHVVRVKHVRRIHHPRKFVRGKAQQRYGRKQVRVGKRMERRGHNTSHQGLETKGKRLQKHGRKNQRSGKRKQHNARF
jgi:hypothetical protein